MSGEVDTAIGCTEFSYWFSFLGEIQARSGAIQARSGAEGQNREAGAGGWGR